MQLGYVSYETQKLIQTFTKQDNCYVTCHARGGEKKVLQFLQQRLGCMDESLGYSRLHAYHGNFMPLLCGSGRDCRKWGREMCIKGLHPNSNKAHFNLWLFNVNLLLIMNGIFLILNNDFYRYPTK